MGLWTLYVTKPHINKATGGHLLVKTKRFCPHCWRSGNEAWRKTKSEFISRKEIQRQMEVKKKNLFFPFRWGHFEIQI